MNRKPMTIEIRLDPADLRRWQDHIVATLVANPEISPGVRPTSRRSPRPAGIDLLFALERLVARGRGGDDATDRLAPETLRHWPQAEGAADLTIDLVGGGVIASSGLHLALDCDGVPPLDGAVAAIVDGRTPVLRLRLVRDGVVRTVARWPVAIEERGKAARSTSLVLGRAAHLVLTAVAALTRGEDPATLDLHVATDLDGPSPGAPTVLGFFAHALSAKIARRLAALCGRAPTWSVVWRHRAAAGDPGRPDLDPTPFRRLLDDGRRFFADPFPWPEGDRIHLFCEEFPFATGRGVISVITIEADGRVGPARPVIETDCHLSYPFVFEHEGRMWMIPETSQRRTVELWMAARFPDQWVRHSVLLENTDLGDATLAEIDGTWWMFGAGRERWCSSWEALQLFHAPAPTGPWTPHVANPVLVDVRSARPAGRLRHTAHGWLRPVQDSSRGYGSGLAVARIEAIGPTRYRETVVQRFHTPAPLTGLHSWNQAVTPAGLFECLDVHVAARDFGASRVLDLAGPSAPPRAG